MNREEERAKLKTAAEKIANGFADAADRAVSRTLELMDQNDNLQVALKAASTVIEHSRPLPRAPLVAVQIANPQIVTTGLRLPPAPKRTEIAVEKAKKALPPAIPPRQVVTPERADRPDFGPRLEHAEEMPKESFNAEALKFQPSPSPSHKLTEFPKPREFPTVHTDLDAE